MLYFLCNFIEQIQRQSLDSLLFSTVFVFIVGELTYHVRTDLGTGSKHEFTLPVGIVDLTRQQGGQLVRSANRFIQEALAVTSAEIQ